MGLTFLIPDLYTIGQNAREIWEELKDELKRAIFLPKENTPTQRVSLENEVDRIYTIALVQMQDICSQYGLHLNDFGVSFVQSSPLTRSFSCINPSDLIIELEAHKQLIKIPLVKWFIKQLR